MILLRSTIFLVCFFTLTTCMAQKALPRNLDEAILFFQQEWPKEDLEDFRNKPEDFAVADLHFSTGLYIRNNWVRGNRNPPLTDYFHGLGVYHPDDISSIIITSLHRTLNQKDIELEEQVESYKAYWKTIDDCDNRRKAQAVSDYTKFEIGDSVIIYMPVDTAYGNSNAVIYMCPSPEWTFDEGKDLIVKGTITDKYFTNDTANVFFTVLINYMNREDTQILMTNVRTGDKRNFSLEGLRIE